MLRGKYMRHTLQLASAIFFIGAMTQVYAQQGVSTDVQKKLAGLEATFDGKMGVYAIDTNNNETIAYRENERFPTQSTLKLIGAAALLKEGDKNKALLHEKIHYTKNDLAAWHWHPVTRRHLADGMTLQELAEAAVSYSDNPAMNLIMKKFGGPQFVTDFAHSIGNNSFNIEHYECNLNSDPHSQQDTSTPKDMAISVKKLTMENVLSQTSKLKLIDWLKNNTTGYKRIRSGVPIGWVVAEKTGSGDYGVTNDIGLMWSPTCKPIVLAVYTIQNKQDAKNRDDIVASATQIVFDELAKNNKCFKALFA